MNNILFYSPYTVFPFHFETDLELIQQHVDQGDQVTFLTCDADLAGCNPNPFHIQERCNACIQRRKNGFELLKLTNKVQFKPWIFLINDDQKVIEQYNELSIKNIHELKSITFQNYDLGTSILSIIIDLTKEPTPEIKQWKNFISKNIRSSLEVYLSIKNHISSGNYEKIYIFNGRSLSLRAALRAAQSSQIETIVHERSGTFNKYRLTYGTYPHDLNYQKLLINNHWHSSQENQSVKQEKACQWFDSRRQGKPQGWYSFTARHDDILPPAFNPQKTNIVIFNSSENEFATIEDWENPIYINQNDGISKLIEHFKSNQDIDFYLRIHPNLKGVKSSQTRFLSNLKNRYNNLHIIGSHEKYSSYLLLDACDLVITFGSTMGIEAAYWKKPSLLLGRAMYEDLDACLRVTSHEEAIRVIQEKSFYLDQAIFKKAHLNSLKYGYYMENHGIPFTIFQQDRVVKLHLNGQRISDGQSIFSKIIWKLKYFYRWYCKNF
ncbi:glycosyl transferase, group 1 (plasmid) [[Synechococcus] sp. NIES-970]|nr:glycosyl transferase, group 1 [[Synechococcus] sp. NIES-970]